MGKQTVEQRVWRKAKRREKIVMAIEAGSEPIFFFEGEFRAWQEIELIVLKRNVEVAAPGPFMVVPSTSIERWPFVRIGDLVFDGKELVRYAG